MAGRKQTPLIPERIEPRACTLPRRLRVLHHTPFFASLPEDDVSQISTLFREQAFHAGEMVYVAGEPAIRLYIVATGKIKLVRTTPDGKSVVLGINGPGDFFGSLSMLGDKTYPDTAVAHTGCCALAIAAGDFQGILKRYPQVTGTALDIVAARLRTLHELVEQLSAHSVEQRIASTLLTLAEKLGEKRGNAVLIQAPLSRQDLAEMTGTTPETASRIITHFRRSGLIRSGRRWVAILDTARLAAETGRHTKYPH
jgi:CRP/FNR family transcriptional regulator, nitrogen oxide reductase regulator